MKHATITVHKNKIIIDAYGNVRIKKLNKRQGYKIIIEELRKKE